MPRRIQLVFCTTVAVLAVRAIAQPSFHGLGVFPGDNSSYAKAISGDGTVVVGSSVISDQYSEKAFRWTASDGLQTLGNPPANTVASAALSVSRDGSVIVGARLTTAGRYEAFRWTFTEGMQPLLPGFSWQGYLSSRDVEISDDGSVIVGINGGGFRLGGAQGFMTGWNWAEMHTNGDGTILAGGPERGNDPPARYLIMPDGTRINQFLGSDPGVAYDISPDGSVVVGRLYPLGRAFCWSTSGEACPPLSDPAWHDTEAWAASADGGVVVGVGTRNVDREAFIADKLHGIRPLQQVLETDFGLDLAGWMLTQAHAVSDDGRTIVGLGEHDGHSPEAWIAYLPTYPVPVIPAVSGVGLSTLAALILTAGAAIATMRRRDCG